MVVNAASISTEKGKNILFIYDRLDIIGGLETRWIDEFHYLKKNNYKVYFLTDKNRFNSEVSKLFSIEKFITIDSVNITVATEFIKLVEQIVQTIKKEKIQVISVHMLDFFTCAAVIAAQLCRIPVISTVHGALDVYRKPLVRLLTQNFIAKSFSLSIQVSKILQNILPLHSSPQIVIPNLVDLNKYKAQTSDITPSWLIVNRISPEKHKSILGFLQAADVCKIPSVDIAGRGKNKELQAQIKALNIKTQVKFLGEVENIAALIPSYTGIAGVGRVAIEGLACHKPVCIIRPSGDITGLVTEDNFQQLKSCNFTGKTSGIITNQELFKQIKNYSSKDSQRIYQFLKEELSIERWDKYIKQYDEVNFIDNQALESFYYKLSYFSNMLSTPFEKDKFFWHLFYETLIEYKLDDIREMYHYYEDSIGLTSDYPNPYVTNKKVKWRDKFK